MELKLENGQYVSSKYGGLETVSSDDELCQRLMMKLTARRGGFAPWQDFGSRLYCLVGGVKSSELPSLAEKYISEALSNENVSIESLIVEELGDGTANFELWLKTDDSKIISLEFNV